MLNNMYLIITSLAGSQLFQLLAFVAAVLGVAKIWATVIHK